MKRIERIVVWSLMGVAIVLFWFSLRTQSNDEALKYTLAALVAWGIAFLAQRFFKKRT